MSWKLPLVSVFKQKRLDAHLNVGIARKNTKSPLEWKKKKKKTEKTKPRIKEELLTFRLKNRM